MGKTLELNDSNFDQVINTDKPVLVAFGQSGAALAK
jgi:hypothetical protein